jgi:NifU-like protein involved in Fe-S cluster formation
MACGSALTELVKGKTIEEAARLSAVEIVESVGGLPEASHHASSLAIEALTSALHALKK